MNHSKANPNLGPAEVAKGSLSKGCLLFPIATNSINDIQSIRYTQATVARQTNAKTKRFTKQTTRHKKINKDEHSKVDKERKTKNKRNKNAKASCGFVTPKMMEAWAFVAAGQRHVDGTESGYLGSPSEVPSSFFGWEGSNLLI